MHLYTHRSSVGTVDFKNDIIVFLTSIRLEEVERKSHRLSFTKLEDGNDTMNDTIVNDIIMM